MTTLTEFLFERIAEDEAIARFNPSMTVVRPPTVRDRGLVPNLRPLRECEAKGRIVEMHAVDADGWGCLTCEVVWPCPTIRAVAVPYQDYPGFQPEWTL